ncbi:FAD-binding oxidoreductase [Orpheovirus IHUMI-LCC2]|uniref:FAD-binding oxidoreductase n=1 Tax=Orpheovirus IHUMI-LCC2 TaxID=2023057 RepID=A0A2I2L4F5_9VIRU|nr:FAD-binding oxidoreductase [Orpheovirus IHUMI-LCC2]SNW62413.1 FAD-binding oxidoreductase [Orpheovirus IHUMI-LCC2]
MSKRSKNGIIYKNKIKYPTSNTEIINIIRKCKKDGKIIRVIGGKHSNSPLVSSNKEKLLLLSLEKYNYTNKCDITIDHTNMTVCVNAGYTLSTLYNELSKYRYFLDTQPTIETMTVGGSISIPITGSKLGAGLLSDCVMGITLINDNGDVQDLTELSNNFELHRMNMGIFGIITYVTFSIKKLKYIQYEKQTLSNIFILQDGIYKMDQKLLDGMLEDIVKKSYNGTGDKELYHHSFIDFHNNKWLSVRWTGNNNVDNNNTEVIESFTRVIDFPPRDFLSKTLVPIYRESPEYLKAMGKLSRGAIKSFIDLGIEGNLDIFSYNLSANVYYFSYFLPVYIDGVSYIHNFYKAINCVMNTIQRYIKDKKKFNLDLPMDIRFVKSSNKCLLSPIYSKEKKIVYAVLNLINSACNIELQYENVEKRYKELNDDYRNFYMEIEKEWVELGAVPKYSTVFGFGGKNNDPFHNIYTKTLLPFSVKNSVSPYTQKLFVNSMMSNILETS